MKYIVVKLDDGGGLRKRVFDTESEARQELEDEFKAYVIITTDDAVKIEDHT